MEKPGHVPGFSDHMNAQVYYNMKKPDFGADWQLRLVATLMFPK
jgi:hypothetical protein